MSAPAPSDLLVVERDGDLLIQAVCDPCGFRGTVYPGRFQVLAVAQANRHDAEVHLDFSGYKENPNDK